MSQLRLVLTAIAIAIAIGGIMGVVGAYFNLPVVVRGGATGVLVIGAMLWLRKRYETPAQKA